MELKNYYGVIISRRSRIGTRSKGPEYYIKLEESNEFGQTELLLEKRLIYGKKILFYKDMLEIKLK